MRAEGRMLADAIMLGVILHQFTHWWEYARRDDKPVVRYIVVCISPTSFWVKAEDSTSL